MRLLAAPDKFRGTLTAREAAAAIAAGAERAGWTADQLPLADGGEGTLDVLGGGNRRTVVTGPLGEPVEAEWRLEDDGTRPDRSGARLRPHARRRRGGKRSASRDEPRRRRARSPPRSPRAPSGSSSRSAESLRPTAASAPSRRCRIRSLDPARGRLRRRRALPRRRRRLRSAEGSDARARCGSCASGWRKARRPRPAGLGRGGRARRRAGGDRRAPRPRLRLRRRAPRVPRTARRRSTSSSPARDWSTRPRSPARSSAASSKAPAPPESRRSWWPETSTPGAAIDAVSLVERYGPERALAEPAKCLAEIVETALAARRN